MRRSTTVLLLVAGMLTAGLLLAACDDDNGETPVDPGTVSTPPPATPEATPTAEPDPDSTPAPTPTPTPGPPEGPDVPEPVTAVPVFEHLELDRPVEAGVWPLGDPGTLYVVEQRGPIYWVTEDDSGVLLDMTGHISTGGNEEGTLSLTLDPDFEENRYVWLYYSAADGFPRTVLSRVEASEDGQSIDLDTELRVLEVEQPYTNHNGGTVRFGNDGMIYVGYGDGGSGADPHGHGQNTMTLLGTIVRLDVSAATPEEPYQLPADNPFVDDPEVMDEIYAYGLRNPWRMDFDPITGELWVGDVGQADVEEISIARPGDNLGWAIMEGDRCYPPSTDCDTEGLRMPVITYANESGRCSVTGGIVYRETAVPELTNAYLFSDWCSGEVWATNADDPDEVLIVAEGLGSVTSFAVGEQGEIYVVIFGQSLRQLVSP